MHQKPNEPPRIPDGILHPILNTAFPKGSYVAAHLAIGELIQRCYCTCQFTRSLAVDHRRLDDLILLPLPSLQEAHRIGTHDRVRKKVVREVRSDGAIETKGRSQDAPQG